ncbi:hypothetical protein F4809DRAFT_666218 [Biscogniauxia mediterranea]|nr:hypothetical protein F4809DRAFT_666218 [Biscogniauxia mediterranea]
MQIPPFLPLLPLLLPTTTAHPLLLPPRDAAPADAPDALPRISSISYSGTGCPSSSPGVDRTGSSWADLAFRMNGLEAVIPVPSTSTVPSPYTSTANCQVHVQVAAAGAAPGWQVGLRDVAVRGRAVLDPGAALEYYVTSFWSQDAGATTTVRGTLSNTGAARLDADVTVLATVPDDRVAWSPCAAAGPDDGAPLGLLNVNFRVALLADGGRYAFFGRAPTESWGYVWRRC